MTDTAPDLPEHAIVEGLLAMEDMLADGASNDTAFRMGLGVALQLGAIREAAWREALAYVNDICVKNAVANLPSRPFHIETALEHLRARG